MPTQPRTEPGTWLAFLVPGTADWEEVEANALGFGVHRYPFRAGHEIWVRERFGQAVFALRECLESDPERLCGVPVLRGTRFSVSQFLAELADSEAISEIADDFEVKEDLLRTFLHALAVYFDQPTSSR